MRKYLPNAIPSSSLILLIILWKLKIENSLNSYREFYNIIIYVKYKAFEFILKVLLRANHEINKRFHDFNFELKVSQCSLIFTDSNIVFRVVYSIYIMFVFILKHVKEIIYDLCQRFNPWQS